MSLLTSKIYYRKSGSTYSCNRYGTVTEMNGNPYITTKKGSEVGYSQLANSGSDLSSISIKRNGTNYKIKQLTSLPDLYYDITNWSIIVPTGYNRCDYYLDIDIGGNWNDNNYAAIRKNDVLVDWIQAYGSNQKLGTFAIETGNKISGNVIGIDSNYVNIKLYSSSNIYFPSYKDTCSNSEVISKGYMKGSWQNSNGNTYDFGNGIIIPSGNNTVTGLVFTNVGFVWQTPNSGTTTVFNNCVFNGRNSNDKPAGFYKGWIANSSAGTMYVHFNNCTFYNNGVEFTQPGSNNNPIVYFYNCNSNQPFVKGYSIGAGWTKYENNCIWNDTTINTTNWYSTMAGNNKGVWS